MDQSLIFHWDNGKPCKIFVEATSVRERPRLVRKIFKHGGYVVNAARDADVVLAENNTKEALELLEAWKGDKILLSTRWVSLCIQENRLLGADRGWGGLELTKQGLLEGIRMQGEDASEDEDDDNDEKPSENKKAGTQPASRTTPAGRARKSEPGPSRTRVSNGSPTSGTPDRRTAYSETPSEDPLRLGSSHPAFPTDGDPSYSQGNTSPQALYSSMFNPLFQQSLQQQMPNLFPPAPSGPLPNFYQFQTLPSPQFNQNQVQLLAQQLLMNPHLLNPQLTQSLEQFNLAGGGQSQPAPTNDGQEARPSRPTPDDLDMDMVSDVASSSKSEEDRVEFALTQRKNKGKERAGNKHSDRKIEKAIRSKPPLSNELAVTDDRGIFTDDWGMPKKFYIMVDLKNRKDLLKMVKKHRGVMTSEMDQADYIILNNRSNQFQKTLSTLPLNKIALSPGWLEACDEKDSVVDMAIFVIDITSGVGQGAPRKRSGPGSRVAPVTREECESEDEDPGRQPEPPVTPVVTPKRTRGRPPTHDAHSPRSGSRSPSPPTEVVQWQSGKYLFTEADRTWFFKYARFKLERKPEMSTTALMKDIGRKAPHHSSKSWEQSSRRLWSDEWAALRRDITALRKSLPTPSATSVSSTAPYSSPPSRSIGTPSRTALQSNNHDLAYPDDSSPMRSQLLPPSSAPVSSSSTQVSPSKPLSSGNLKRKETSDDVRGNTVIVDRNGKRVKVANDVIDVDSFPDP